MSLHSVVAPASVVNDQLGVWLFPGEAGAEVIVTAGPVVSRVYVSLDMGPVFPTGSPLSIVPDPEGHALDVHDESGVHAARVVTLRCIPDE